MRKYNSDAHVSQEQHRQQQQKEQKTRKGRIPERRRGCGGGSTANEERCVSCTTFNILAPIYKRLDDEGCRESQNRACWLSRNQSIIDRLLGDRSSVICLQEVWLGNGELVGMYERRLGDAGYISLKLARTNNRGDGLLTAVRRDCFRVLHYKELLFNDFGDRVAQLLHVESVVPSRRTRNSSTQQQILIVNTHLPFPHDHSLCIVRLHQITTLGASALVLYDSMHTTSPDETNSLVYKLLQCVESYQNDHKLNPMPVILCGDWNGSKRGHVYRFLRSQGFVSSYDTAHHYTDSDADAHKWVSHRNHRGDICGVDFIWLRNPDKYRKPLKSSWNEAVFGIIKYLLRGASLTEDNAFSVLRTESAGDHVTYSGFCQALCKLGLAGNSHGLTAKEVEDLWAQADIDGNGVVDYGEFQLLGGSPTWSENPEETGGEGNDKGLQKGMAAEGQAFGLSVKDAVLFPPEAEKGMWPENYSLSDHAPLTVVFSPVGMS